MDGRFVGVCRQTHRQREYVEDNQVTRWHRRADLLLPIWEGVAVNGRERPLQSNQMQNFIREH